MSVLISAALASAFAEGVPSEIVYIPEGEHTITPWVDGKPKTITVKVPADKGPAIAATLQAALAKREKSNVRPWFDFEHKGGAASALPKSFRYEVGKGIMCGVEWTGTGRKALEGKDFSYLSPTFLIDDDGYPDGLPERGPLAALLNEPAFREIPRIAASDAAVDHELTKPPIMSKLIFAALAISAAADNAETAAVQAIEKLKTDHQTVTAANATLETENKSLKDKVEAAETAAKEAKTAGYKAKVEAAVTAGKIAPKDEETKTQALELLEASEAIGSKFLDAMPAKFAALDKNIVTGDFAKPVQAADKFDGKTGAQLLEAALAEEFDAAQ